MLSNSDTNSIISSFLDKYGFLDHAIKSMNDAYERGIPQIIQNQFKIDRVYKDHRMGSKDWKLKNSDFEYVHVVVTASNPRIKKPTTIVNGNESPLYPNQCREKNSLYGGLLICSYEVYIDYKTKDGEEFHMEPIYINDLSLGKIPIMLHTSKCNLWGSTKEELINIGEDPLDRGGSFLIGDNNWSINLEEKPNIFNNINVYLPTNYKDFLARASIISKHGDWYQNTKQFILTYREDGSILFELSYREFIGQEIPFYILFRLLNVTRDIDIVRYIIGSSEFLNDDKYLFDIIRRAMHVDYKKSDKFHILTDINDPDKLKHKLSEILYDRENSEGINNIINKHFFPHLGIDKHMKALFLGVMIKKMLTTFKNPELKTDRDILSNKTIGTPGLLFCNNFKTLYQNFFIGLIDSMLKKKLNKKKLEDINISHIFSVAAGSGKLENKLKTSITSADTDKEGGNDKFTTQKIYFKNDANAKNAKRIIQTKTNVQTARNNAIRFVNGSYMFAIDPAYTNDTGKKVGTNKSMAITCRITQKKESGLIREKLIEDPDIFPITDPESIYGKGLVMLNGILIGYTDNIYTLRQKYVDLRRQGLIYKFMGISCESKFNEIDFRVDDGRITFPIIIVYNNINNPEMFDKTYNRITGENFEQKILFTKQQAKDLKSGKLSIDDVEGIEWIDVREAIYCVHAAENMEEFYTEQNNPLERFTHIGIPAAIYGHLTLTQPFANKNPENRSSFQGKLVKAACSRGSYAKNAMLKMHWTCDINENPLCKTIINDYLVNAGNNLVIAIMSWYGRNQEDAIIFNKKTIDRGIFNVTYANVDQYNIETKEILNTPKVDITEKIRANNYGKLKNGLIDPGTIIETGDVIIGKYIPSKGEGKKRYTDTSIVNKKKHSVEVVRCDEIINDDGSKVIKIKTSHLRKPREGDKFCVPEDHYIHTLRGWIRFSELTQEDHIYTYGGYTNNFTICKFECVDEKLYVFKGDNTKIICTADHNLLYLHDNVLSLVKAKNLIDKKIQASSNVRFPETKGYLEGYDPIIEFIGYRIYTGNVMCVSLLQKIFMYRMSMNHRPMWSGNSSRHGQKGVICQIIPNHLMPYNKDGVTPDIIMNPHAFPSRRTAGQLVEMLVAKLNSIKGIMTDNTVFNYVDINSTREELESMGFTENEQMYHGLTGEPIEEEICLGVVYTQRIQKSIYDSAYSVYKPVIDPYTRQPVDGAKKGGGVKLGEMENQALAASGAALTSQTLYARNSDGFYTPYCRCGLPMVFNDTYKIYSCSCGNPLPVKRASYFTSNVLEHIIRCMDVNLSYEFE